MTVQLLFIIIGVIATIIGVYRNIIQKKGEGLGENIVQNFLGILFIFSGVVKAIDPRGTAYKMHEYFESFAQDGFRGFWEMMSEYSLPISIFMIVLEIVLGVMLLVGRKPKVATIGMLAINLFFLYLTGYSYLSGFCLSKSILIISAVLLGLVFLASFVHNHTKRNQAILLSGVLVLLYFIYVKMTGNGIGCAFTASKMKVTDCGCFGDFMKLKTWETFYKDIFLTILSAYLVVKYHKLKPIFSGNLPRNIVAGGLALSTLFALYNTFWNEPVVDFRPYAIGSNINEKMKEIEPSVVENILIYTNKSTGQDSRFSINNLPTDTVWAFKDRIDSVIKEGIPAPIHNLRFEDVSGNDVTSSLLNEAAASYWVVIYNIDKSNKAMITEKIIPFATEMRKKGVNVYCLIGKTSADFEKQVSPSMDVVHADETALKTMIRSNPGVMKIQNGVVLDKWHYRQFNGDN